MVGIVDNQSNLSFNMSKKFYTTIDEGDEEKVVLPKSLKAINKELLDLPKILMTLEEAAILGNEYLFSPNCSPKTTKATVRHYGVPEKTD